ncbi:hypothetical protein HW132_22260 [Brasilonema sp. CT11]|nr:hypothetical protein [Brasilonema sp. CT11]
MIALSSQADISSEPTGNAGTSLLLVFGIARLCFSGCGGAVEASGVEIILGEVGGCSAVAK